jgi:soluble lytic murein transglycosylase-like protein
LLFGGMMLAFPHKIRHPPEPAALLRPMISVSIDNVIAIPANRAYASIIAEAAKRYGVDAALIKSVMQAESAFNPFAVSPAGAMGLMQLMPDVAAEHGANQPFDPRENIMAGTRYLRELLDRHHGNVRLTLASYNAGPTVVTRYAGVPPFPETVRYVKTVTDLLAAAHAPGNNN